MKRIIMRPLAAFAYVLAMSLAFAPAKAQTYHITNDLGGVILLYMQRFERLRDSGLNVVIDGPCISACTMVLGYIDRSRICATHRALLGFHSAYSIVNGMHIPSADSTQTLLNVYPAHVNAWIRRMGGLRPHVMNVVAPEVYQLVRPCDPQYPLVATPVPTQRVRGPRGDNQRAQW